MEVSSVVSVSPFRCRMWSLHDRLDDYITEDTCKAEIVSFERQGQLVPALGRPLKKGATHEIELIYGARRLFIARHLNVPLRVELREMSDQEAIVAMDAENRQRADISPYERGLSYARWLRSGFFRSQDEIARALRVSSSYVSRLLKIARLPSVVVGAFARPTDIYETWGLALMDAIDDPLRRELVLRKARALEVKSTRLPAREVYRELLRAAGRVRKSNSIGRDEIVRDPNGAALFRIREQRKVVAVLLPVEKLSTEILDDIKEKVAQSLQRQYPRSTKVGASAP